jgi:hypothetical protein
VLRAPEPPAGLLEELLPADDAVRGIVLANVVTIAFAYLGGSLLLLLWPYWLQSLVIGYYAQRRIRLLHDFSTEGVRINNRPVDPTPATKRWTANFFIVHYGFFHVGYFVFLMAFTRGAFGSGAVPITDASGRVHQVMMGQVGPWDVLVILALGVGFWRTHQASFREHVAADLRGRPNIGTLMFMPYLRIIPMHITIIVGALVGAKGGVILFGALKTLADVAMHKVEHRLLQPSAGAAAVTPPT